MLTPPSISSIVIDITKALTTFGKFSSQITTLRENTTLKENVTMLLTIITTHLNILQSQSKKNVDKTAKHGYHPLSIILTIDTVEISLQEPTSLKSQVLVEDDIFTCKTIP